ncbi:hypothetical protein KCP69_24795 [Salmonella enterica subsp. enterica]|nr:hypothetical protein KCP69_24795 [Salmonella enterica subsp. enterica]
MNTIERLIRKLNSRQPSWRYPAPEDARRPQRRCGKARIRCGKVGDDSALNR